MLGLPVIGCLSINCVYIKAWSHALLWIISSTASAPFDLWPITVWLHLDPSRSSGHGTYRSDLPLIFRSMSYESIICSLLVVTAVYCFILSSVWMIDWQNNIIVHIAAASSFTSHAYVLHRKPLKCPATPLKPPYQLSTRSLYLAMW